MLPDFGSELQAFCVVSGEPMVTQVTQVTHGEAIHACTQSGNL